MLVQSSVASDSRVLREAQTVAEAGHAVHIVGRSVPDEFTPPPGVTVESVTKPRGIRPSGMRAGVTVSGTARSGLARAGRWLLLPEHRRRTERRWRAAARQVLASSRSYDVVHAHDYNTLTLAVELADRWSATLIYDSHELWFDRRLPGRPTPLWCWRGRRHETRLAGRARTVLTVSEGIAERFRGRGLTDVRVVRNSFPMSDDLLPGPSDAPVGIGYAGRVGAGRDLETLVAVAPAVTPHRVVLAGPVDPGFRLDTSGVELRPPMSVDEVDRMYRELGIAVVTLTDSCDNHRLAMPNKLFHAVRAGVPVVAADLPELRAVVRRYELGALYRPGHPASLAEAVEAVAADYSRWVRAVRAARPALSWERDAAVLLRAYHELVPA